MSGRTAVLSAFAAEARAGLAGLGAAGLGAIVGAEPVTEAARKSVGTPR
jgi:hypothetical protein